jgi:hypothetical protein
VKKSGTSQQSPKLMVKTPAGVSYLLEPLEAIC